jgi:hypothetical protein
MSTNFPSIFMQIWQNRSKLGLNNKYKTCLYIKIATQFRKIFNYISVSAYCSEIRYIQKETMLSV